MCFLRSLWHHLPNLSTPISPAPQSLSPPLRPSEITIRTSVPEAEFCHLDLIEMAPYSVEAFEHLFTTLWNPSMLFPTETDHFPSGLSKFHFAIISQHICLFYYRKTFGLFPIWGYHELCFCEYSVNCELVSLKTFWGPLCTYSCWICT